MEEPEKTTELTKFLNSGIYRLDNNSNTIFVDPVRILSRSYTHFRVSPSLYYSRFFKSKPESQSPLPVNPKKRKRKQRKLHILNEREQSADQRHQEARTFLLRAHEALLGASDLLSVVNNLNCDRGFEIESEESSVRVEKVDAPSFIDLRSVWQAPLYEISLHFDPRSNRLEDEGLAIQQYNEPKVFSIFNNLVTNDSIDDAEAEFLGNWYIIPRRSCFHMSDLEQFHDLIPAKTDHGFNLIVIDPPWENRSACQKSVYPTLPNRYFLSLPIKELTHREGAIVALWVTNREKLRIFIEKELFPMWGVSYSAIIYWLKVKEDGSLISELDLFHHRPYECLLLGYSQGEGMDSKNHSAIKTLPEIQVIISIPGDYSRKPPIGELLLDYVPGPKPARCIEIFARELLAGWTSWGNEPLHFQESRYFIKKERVDNVILLECKRNL